MKSIDLTSMVSIVALVLYFFIAAQGAFYHFGFAKALYNLPAEQFIELRKSVDPVVRGRFKALYLSALGVVFLWLILSDRSAGFLSYAPVLFALLLLVADMVLILRFSEPVNELINSDLLNTQAGYSNARAEWLKFILIRGYLSMSGFMVLLVHFVLKSR